MHIPWLQARSLLPAMAVLAMLLVAPPLHAQEPDSSEEPVAAAIDTAAGTLADAAAGLTGTAEEPAAEAKDKAEAEEAADPMVVDGAPVIDHLWTLIAALLVFFMQPGFAMLESGFTRAKNATNVVAKNIIDFCIGSLTFWAIGFGLMFGPGQWIGVSGFFMQFNDDPISAWTFTFLLFQTVFAATAATIVSGAVAERIQFRSYLVYTVFLTALIYPIFGHWAWGNLLAFNTGEDGTGPSPWLIELGFIDFAGSTVVHSMGAWAGLAGAMVLGPRLGKYGPNGEVRAIPGHSLPMAALGMFILWFGWFGFNAGSTTAFNGEYVGSAVSIAVKTNLAAAAGGLLSLLTIWIKTGKPDVGIMINGVLAGLVAITAGCDFVSTHGAVIIGALAGVVVVFSVFMFDALKLDDPVGAVSVHGVCGALGTLLLVFFPKAAAEDYNVMNQLLVQLAGIGACFGLAFGSMFVLFSILKAVGWLRVSPEEEETGLDLGEHGNEAYPDFTPQAG